jgi:peptide/nickel transport system permease protein
VTRADIVSRLLWRVLHACLLLVGVSVLSFLFLDLAPGDYFTEAALQPQTSPTTIQRLRSDYGLSRPLPVRYGRWLAGTLRGELGISLAYNQPVAGLLAPRIRNTLLLTVTSLCAAWCIAMPLGVWAASRGGWADRLAWFAITVPLTIPELILGALLVYWAAHTGWLPAGGMTSGDVHLWRDIIRHATLPVMVLTAGSLPLLVRQIRSAVKEAADAPFVRAAESLGIPPARLWFRHILPTAANPLVSLGGLSIAGLLSSSLVVETIFGWPGLGPLFLEAVLARDTYLILAPVMCSATLLIAANLLADILLYAADPRIRVRA